MTLRVTEILGRADEVRFAARRVARLPVTWDEASKRRLRREASDGTDVAIDLPRGSYLAEGDVLVDDGNRVIVVERVGEAALVVRFDSAAPPERLVAQALALGHAFGNQHAPVDVDGVEARLPLTTSEEIARATIEALGLDVVRVETAEVAFGRFAPMATGHSHGNGHGQDDGETRRHDNSHVHGDPRGHDHGHGQVNAKAHSHVNGHATGLGRGQARGGDDEVAATRAFERGPLDSETAVLDEAHSLLAAFQLSDSALPIGRFVHSNGLEAWLRANESCKPEELAELIAAVVSEGVAPLDGAALAHAHRADSLAALCELDAHVTAHKLTPSARAASHACGRQLASLAQELAPDSLPARFAACIRSGDVDGNLAVVQGAFSRALGLPLGDAVLLELRGSVAGLLSAAVRLGRLSPLAAQRELLRLRATIAAAAAEAIRTGVDELSSTTPELEIFALTHRRADARFFST